MRRVIPVPTRSGFRRGSLCRSTNQTCQTCAFRSRAASRTSRPVSVASCAFRRCCGWRRSMRAGGTSPSRAASRPSGRIYRKACPAHSTSTRATCTGCPRSRRSAQSSSRRCETRPCCSRRASSRRSTRTTTGSSRASRAEPRGLTVIGAPETFDSAEAANVRRLLRRNIARCTSRRRRHDDLGALLLVAPLAHIEEERVTAGLRGMNPATYGAIDLIALVADGQSGRCSSLARCPGRRRPGR